MFAVFQALGITPPADLDLDGNVAENIDALRQAAEAKASEAREDLVALPAAHPDRPAALTRLQEAERGVENLEGLDPIFAEVDDGQDIFAGTTGIVWVDETLLKKWREQPELMLYKLQANS